MSNEKKTEKTEATEHVVTVSDFTPPWEGGITENELRKAGCLNVYTDDKGRIVFNVEGITFSTYTFLPADAKGNNDRIQVLQLGVPFQYGKGGYKAGVMFDFAERYYRLTPAGRTTFRAIRDAAKQRKDNDVKKPTPTTQRELIAETAAKVDKFTDALATMAGSVGSLAEIVAAMKTAQGEGK
jgi:hypothetical protein